MQDVVRQRFAEEARHLRRVGGVRRHEEGRRIGHRGAVPAHLAGLRRQQAQQRPQQRRLARADAPGDDGKRAAWDAERHALDARARLAVVEIGQPVDVQQAQPVGVGLGRGGHGRDVAVFVKRPVGDEAFRRRVGCDLLEAVEHDALLGDFRDIHTNGAGEVGRQEEIGGEQGEIADGEAALPQHPGGGRLPQQQDHHRHGNGAHAVGGGMP